MQSKQRTAKFIVWPTLAAAIAIAGVTSQVQAEGSSSAAEVQRGVPGVDVDLNANKSTGLDVDLQAGNRNDSDNGVPGVDVDTRTAGAGPETTIETDGMRAPIQDRN